MAVPPSTNATSSLHALLRVCGVYLYTFLFKLKHNTGYANQVSMSVFTVGSSTCVKVVEFFLRRDPLHLTKCLWNAQPFKGCRLKCSQHLKQTYKQMDPKNTTNTLLISACTLKREHSSAKPLGQFPAPRVAFGKTRETNCEANLPILKPAKSLFTSLILPFHIYFRP